MQSHHLKYHRLTVILYGLIVIKVVVSTLDKLIACAIRGLTTCFCQGTCGMKCNGTSDHSRLHALATCICFLIVYVVCIAIYCMSTDLVKLCIIMQLVLTCKLATL